MLRLSSGPGTDRTPVPREHCLLAAPCPPNPAAVPRSAGSSVTHVGANRSLQPLRARLPGQPLPGQTRALTKLRSRDVSGHLPGLGVHVQARATPQVSPRLPLRAVHPHPCPNQPPQHTHAPAPTFGPREPRSPSGPGFPREPFGNIWEGGVSQKAEIRQAPVSPHCCLCAHGQVSPAPKRVVWAGVPHETPLGLGKLQSPLCSLILSRNYSALPHPQLFLPLCLLHGF